MFKGMYDLMNQLKKKPMSEKVALQKNPTPILSETDLLSSEKRQASLTEIRTLLNLPEDEYNKVFLSVIHRFALYVQNLPETERSFYSSLGGMLDHAIERSQLSLFLARTYLLPEGTTLASVSEEEMLWVYAIFTASLLLDVGKVPTRHVVNLMDVNGNMLHAWNPYVGVMQKNTSTHYTFGFIDEPNDHLRWKITPLLARQIMGEEGFLWLASNEEVLEAWLSLLSDDHTTIGWLRVIPLADAQILEGYFTDRKVYRHSLSPQTIALINKIIKERKAAEKGEKITSEEKLAKDLEKALDKKDKKDKTDKTEKETELEAAIQAQQEKLRTVAREAKESHLSEAERKEIVGNFINWINQEHDRSKVGNAHVEIERVRGAVDGVIITSQMIERFISDNKLSQLSVESVSHILQQQNFANPWTIARMTGEMKPELVVMNASLVFANSMAYSLGVESLAPKSTVEVKVTPIEDKAAELAKDAAAKAERSPSPTPYHTGTRR